MKYHLKTIKGHGLKLNNVLKMNKILLISLGLLLSGCGSDDDDSSDSSYYRDEVSNKVQTVFEAADFTVQSVPDEIATTYRLDTSYYKKYIDVWGMPILSSSEVSDAILQNAAEVTAKFLSDENLTAPTAMRNTLYRHYFRVVIFPGTFNTSDVPENATFPDALGYGVTKERATLSSTEDALTNYGSYGALDQSRAVNNNPGMTLLHELTHAIHYLYAKDTLPSFDDDLETAYQNAKGIWESSLYFMKNSAEYIAGTSEMWFGRNGIDFNGGAYGYDLNDELKAKDPDAYEMLSRFYHVDGLTNTDFSFQRGHSYIDVTLSENYDASKHSVEIYTFNADSSEETLNNFVYLSNQSELVKNNDSSIQFYEFYGTGGFFEIPAITDASGNEVATNNLYVFDNYRFVVKNTSTNTEIYSCTLSKAAMLATMTAGSNEFTSDSCL